MKTFMFTFVFECICVYRLATSYCPVCTNIDHFSHLLRYNSALHSTYKVFTDFGLLRCVQQCMFRTRCQSINFEVSTQTCELNEAASSGPSFRNGSAFTNITDWSKRLALVCEEVICTTDRVCEVQKQQDAVQAACVQDDVSPVDKGYTKAPGLPFFYKTYRAPEVFDNASITCQNEGGRLIEPDTEEKNDFIHNFVQENALYLVYIGARYLADDWKWVSSNATLTFNDWGHNEPTTGSQEHCAFYSKPSSYKWINKKCGTKMYFICEITVT